MVLAIECHGRCLRWRSPLSHYGGASYRGVVLAGGALCGATQMFNHIPGAMAIVNKAQLVASLHRLGDSLGPALRDEVDQLMPESYIMADKGECARFVDRHVFCQFEYTGCIP